MRKNLVSHTFCIVEDNFVLHNKNYIGMKHPYLMVYMCNLFEILKYYCRPPYLLMS